ncbi:MAG: hypothetical protein JW954_01800 [Dehalococcoidaceae bacterium]|nr:hypothetical protein [Dehalococcoidaceae bacterium]
MGDVLGTFPEQTPCLEHNNSIYPDEGIECQTCHMPHAEGSVSISNVGTGFPAREPFSQHYFVGSNKVMLKLLKDNVDALGITASSSQFDDTITRLDDLLENQTASMVIRNAGKEGNVLSLDVGIQQMVGHKFPTGFPSRRVWLHVTVTSPTGGIIFESGKPAPDGSITGCDADTDPGRYEPHYDIIYRQDQVQIYEAIMQDPDGNVTYTLLRASEFVKDNRLLPLGFDIQNAAKGIAVKGAAVNDADFTSGYDQISYQINTGAYFGPFNVRVELLMQTISYRFIQDLYNDQNVLADKFIELYDDAAKMPVLVTSAETIIP